jgi:hypothetical protein
VGKQLRLAHDYRNDLGGIERRKRERHVELLQRLCPDFVEAELAVASTEAELGAARERIQAERKRQGTKTPVGVEAVVTRVKELRAELQERRAELRAIKKASYERPEVAAAMAANAEQAKAEAAEVKQSSGLYWGTEATVQAACKSFGTGAPPRFARWTGEGQLAVQFIGGMPVAELLEPNTLCWIEGGGRVRQAHFRVTSADRRPVWVTVDVVFHRELPEGGVVKWAYLERRKLANKDRYKLRLSIEVPEVQPTTPEGSMAVLHLGWRANRDGSVRVGLVGNGERSLDVMLPWRFFDQWDQVDVIRSARDRGFNDAKAMVAKAIEMAEAEADAEAEAEAELYSLFDQGTG